MSLGALGQLPTGPQSPNFSPEHTPAPITTPGRRANTMDAATAKTIVRSNRPASTSSTVSSVPESCQACFGWPLLWVQIRTEQGSEASVGVAGPLSPPAVSPRTRARWRHQVKGTSQPAQITCQEAIALIKEISTGRASNALSETLQSLQPVSLTGLVALDTGWPGIG